MIEFLGWPLCRNILRVQPNQVTFSKVRCNSTSAIRRSLILCLRNRDLFAAVIVQVGKRLGEVVRVRVGYGDIERERCSRVVAVVSIER